jgi:hypothetical protein
MKSMKDCKTQEEKNELMRETFNKTGLKVEEGYNYINSLTKIPFKIISRNNKFYGLNGLITWSNVQKKNIGFNSLTQQSKDIYSRSVFEKLGISPLEKCLKIKQKIIFKVIDQKNEYYGYKGATSLSAILSGKGWNCQSLLTNEWKRYIDNFCKKKNYKVLIYPKNAHDHLIVETEFGNKWKTTLTSMRNGNYCPLDTNASFGERCLNEILKVNDINFEYQKTIYHLNGSRQYMDFYLPDYNICIEYMGEQHYENTDRTNLKWNQEQDLKKYKYCKKHNIKWTEIPYIYDSIDKITKYISKKVLNKELKFPDSKSVQYSNLHLYEVNEIIESYEKYKSSTLVSKKFNMSPAAVIKILRKNNVKTYGNNKPVVQLDTNGNLLHIYEKAVLAEIFIPNLFRGGICRTCKGIQDSSMGYKWMYLSDYRKYNPNFTDEELNKVIITETNKNKIINEEVM